MANIVILKNLTFSVKPLRPTLYLFHYTAFKTFEHFSSDFEFGLCYDFSFWRTETGRCIPMEMNYEETDRGYIFPPLCNRTEFNCLDNIFEPFRKYCPNNNDSCESYDQKKDFFCINSKTCVPKGDLIYL